jgi:hypothetical protein
MVKGIELFAGHFKGFEDSYDVFRLTGTLTEEKRISLPEGVARDFHYFIDQMLTMSDDEQKNIAKSIDERAFDSKTTLGRLRAIYGVS